MKNILRLLLLSLSMNSLADTFLVAGSSHDFSEKDKLLLKGCEKNCDALTMIQKHNKIDLKVIRKGMSFTNSVGSDVCSRVYGADSVFGQAPNRDRRAFCLFKDGSMVEMNSLSEYLIEKKFVR